MAQRILSLVLIMFFVAACQESTWSRERKEKTGKMPWSQEVHNEPATVPFKGQALAANTFIQISKVADLGVVNIRTTRIVKQGQQNSFSFGPKKGSPFEEFFGGQDPFQHFFGGPGGGVERKTASLGSGFILNKEGYIVTNNHVVAKMDAIEVTIGKDQDYEAKVVGADPKTDVALIKIEPREDLNPLPLGDSDQLLVGEIVVAIGNPFGLSHTVTQGIVSAKERTIGYGPYDNFIQTDASINPGNSGGPLLNLKGEVVGINSAIMASGQGIGFAIPINLAKEILSQLEEKGGVTRGWLGVVIQPVDDEVATSFGLKEPTGALVSNVQKGSPADKAGLARGDLILRLNGKKISEFNELPRMIALVPVGQKVTIDLLRNKKTISTTVVIGEMKADQGFTEEAKPKEERSGKPDALGLKVGPLSKEMARQLNVSPGGVVVLSVDPNGVAAEKGVRSGDLIIEVNRKKIGNVGHYDKILKTLKKSDTVLLLVKRRGGGTLFLAFTL